MHKNIGRFHEDEFVNAINGKKAGDLSHNLKHTLKEIFGIFDPNEILKCELVDHYQKPDFFIEYKGIRKYISLKSGRADEIAQEDLKSFILYLRKCGLSIRSQNTILLYHFGDGTNDGSGKSRMDYNGLRLLLKDRIKELNEELNSSPEFVMKFIERHLFKGTVETNIEADYIYYGTIEYGIICSKTQIMKHIKRRADTRNWDYMDNPHIGPIQFRPHARYINKKIASEERRWKVTIWWANLQADLAYISERYDG